VTVADAVTDRERVTRMAQGDTTALAELYDVHGSTVYSLALRIVVHVADAEEVVQEVFAQAWHQARRYDASRVAVVGWLLMITRARALDVVRARKARPDLVRPVAVPELPSSATGQEAAVLSEEAVAQVRTALSGLEDPLRIPIELAYYEGLSQSEIAERLNEPLGTIKTRMRTALSRLRTALWAEEPR
jgi:RNA polymerase sigma-70 factor (ECF subfamily)